MFLWGHLLNFGICISAVQAVYTWGFILLWLMKQQQSSEFMPVGYYDATSWSMAASRSVWKAGPPQIQTPRGQVKDEGAHCFSIPVWIWSSQPQQISQCWRLGKQSVLSSRDLILLFAWLSGETSLPYPPIRYSNRTTVFWFTITRHNAGRSQ